MQGNGTFAAGQNGDLIPAGETVYFRESLTETHRFATSLREFIVSDPNPRTMLRELLLSRFVGVLTTTDAAVPRPCLVGYVATPDLTTLVFVTPRQTRKFANIERNPAVAFLVDNRQNTVADVREAVAATAFGEARELLGAEREDHLPPFVQRHPSLDEFARSPTSAMIGISVRSFELVWQFQNVLEIQP